MRDERHCCHGWAQTIKRYAMVAGYWFDSAPPSEPGNVSFGADRL